jgi:16S rRNA (cytosine1402-N4)-methyltransferase
MLEWLPSAVRDGGVAVTIAYHSGEDRAVTRTLAGRGAARHTRWPEPAPPPLQWTSLTRKVVTPSAEEIAANPRARSARLRAFRRVFA